MVRIAEDLQRHHHCFYFQHFGKTKASQKRQKWIIVKLKCQPEVKEGQLLLVQPVQLRLAEIKSNIQT